MKTSRLKRVMIYAFSTFSLLAMILAVHIYMVYKPKAPDAHTRIMARIDIKQQITTADSGRITFWMYQQKGVDHVLVNPHTNIVIFTFFPVKVSGNQIVRDFKTRFSVKAERFIPTAENLKHSCPVAASSFTYKVYKLIDQHHLKTVYHEKVIISTINFRTWYSHFHFNHRVL